MIAECINNSDSLKHVTAQAPAKIILVGEYVVLEEAPAVVMSFDRYAKVAVEAINGEYHQFNSSFWRGNSNLSAQQTEAVSLKLNQQKQIVWHPDSQKDKKPYRLVADIMHAMSELEFIDENTPAFRVSLDSQDFFMNSATSEQKSNEQKSKDNTVKLGLGSSAALTVSLASALASYNGKSTLVEDKANWLKHLLAIHRQFQNGTGSGADLAASLYGGLIVYQLTEATLTPKVTPITWPDDLHCLCIWSGSAASTSDFVERYKTWRQQARSASEALINDLKTLAVACAKAITNKETKTLLDNLRSYAEGLKQLSSASGVDIFSPQHRHIEVLANSVGAIYKPCGAGGGDIGLALASDPECLCALEQKLTQSGFTALHGSIDQRGLSCMPGATA